MKINNETVYVIYHNGKPYEASNRKTVYTKRGSANGVITTIAKDEARYGYDYWNLSDEERKKVVEKIKSEFKVVEYKPVIILDNIKNDIVSIGDIISTAMGYGEQVDIHLLSEKLHKMYLELDNIGGNK